MTGSRAPRLLIVAQPVVAGVPRAVLDLVAGWSEQATVDPATGPGIKFQLDVACPRGSELWLGLEGNAGVRLHPIPAPRRPALGDVMALVRLVLLARRADIVHAHSSKSGLLARLAARLAGRSDRCVFTPHGWSMWALDGPAQRVAVWLEKRAARWCSAIICVSEWERSAGLAAGIGRPEQYHVIPNGVDLGQFSTPPAPTPGRAVMIARLAEPKQPALAIEALALVRQRLPNATLDVVGDGPQRPALERLIADGQLDGAVRLLGTRTDVPDILRRAACLVLATRYEGCPLTVLEAMAAGVPVVTTPFPGAHEVVETGTTGIICPPGAGGLAEGLATVLADPELAKRLGTAGRRRAEERHSRVVIAARVDRVYRSLLAG